MQDWFLQLHPKDKREAIAEKDARLGAEQERLKHLENRRWNDGAELVGEDFLGIMELVNRHGHPSGG